MTAWPDIFFLSLTVHTPWFGRFFILKEPVSMIGTGLGRYLGQQLPADRILSWRASMRHSLILGMARTMAKTAAIRVTMLAKTTLFFILTPLCWFCLEDSLSALTVQCFFTARFW
jgi:hypothetical protein